MTMRTQRWRDLPPQPWRNGAGVTRTLAARDDTWRISIAEILGNGPYSRFPDTHRESLVLHGDDVVLTGDETIVRLSRAPSSVFDGDAAWHATLTGNAVSMLNVIARRQVPLPCMRIVARRVEGANTGTVVVLALDAACGIVWNGASVTLEPGAFALLEDRGTHADFAISPRVPGTAAPAPSPRRPAIVITLPA